MTQQQIDAATRAANTDNQDTRVIYTRKGEARAGYFMYENFRPSRSLGIQDIETGDYHDIHRALVKVETEESE